MTTRRERRASLLYADMLIGMGKFYGVRERIEWHENDEPFQKHDCHCNESVAILKQKVLIIVILILDILQGLLLDFMLRDENVCFHSINY